MSNPLSPEESAAIFDQLTAELGSVLGPEGLGISLAPEPEPEPARAPEPEPAPESAPAAAPTLSAEPQPFSFGQDRGPASQRLHGLERMSEKLARALRPAIEPIARARVSVTPDVPETIPYGEWQDAQDDFTTLTLYRLRPLTGGMLIQIDPSFLACLVEIFYGGSPAGNRARKPGDLTASEELLLDRLVEKVANIIAEHWNDVVPVELARVGRETNSAHLPFLRADDLAVVQKFNLTGLIQPTAISVLYPLSMLKPIEEKLQVQAEGTSATDEDWRRRLGDALEQVSLPVRSVLARPEISVAELLALKPGDVIPITLPPRTPLLAGARRIADGVIGEQDGRAALMIEKVGNA